MEEEYLYLYYDSQKLFFKWRIQVDFIFNYKVNHKLNNIYKEAIWIRINM